MMTKLPVQLIKSRFLSEIPRVNYLDGPKLESNDEKSRQSFISLLRKGPSKKARSMQNSTPSEITLNCAAWLSSKEPLVNAVTLMLHYKDTKEEYYVIVDESSPSDLNSVMLSGNVTFRPKGNIEFIKVCCAGLTKDHPLVVDELHVKRIVEQEPEEFGMLSA